ncbi:hypothetical protein ACF0H5_012253 [Mactra antiquata]
MSQFDTRQLVKSPALEGSKAIQPVNAFPGRPIPPDGRMNGNYMGGYPHGAPPMWSAQPYVNVMPAERISVPTLMQRPRMPYAGPRSVMPYWGGHSVAGRYFPAKKPNVPNRPNSMFLFGIILKEIVAALHRIYLNPNGNIYPVLIDIIGPNCYDLALLVHGGFKDSKEESVLIQELQYVVENVIYHITEIMPGTGVLGTHRKSAVYELIRNGKRFPEGYFWQCEMDRLQFNENGRTVNIGDVEAFLLMLGIFISRSLVTTILLKPVDYGLSSEPITETAERNLRVVASTILYLVRRIAVARGQGIMDMPAEIAKYLYSDQEMQHVYGKLSRTFNYCEGLLREWGTEYVRRLHASTNAEHQQRYE